MMNIIEKFYHLFSSELPISQGQIRHIPFSGHYTADLDRPNNRHRLKRYRKFMGVETFEGRDVLDIGAPNFISRELRVRDNTRGDLNRGIRAPSKDYEVITCFEVISHVMNPLLVAQGMFELLRPGGRLFLATPKQWLIPWYHGRGNFVEYKPHKLKQMMEYVGFEVVRYEERNPWMWTFIFYGIRPPLRFLFNRYQLWEFRKPNRFSGADI